MAKKSDSIAAPKPIEVRLGEPEPDTLRAFGGSKSDRFNNALIDSMVKTGWFPPGHVGRRSRQAALRRGHRPAGVQARRRDRGHACRPGDGGAPRIDGVQPPSDAPGSAVRGGARASARRLRMRPARSSSCSRRWTASAARAASRWSVSSMCVVHRGRPGHRRQRARAATRRR